MFAVNYDAHEDLRRGFTSCVKRFINSWWKIEQMMTMMTMWWMRMIWFWGVMGRWKIVISESLRCWAWIFLWKYQLIAVPWCRLWSHVFLIFVTCCTLLRRSNLIVFIVDSPWHIYQLFEDTPFQGSVKLQIIWFVLVFLLLSTLSHQRGVWKNNKLNCVFRFRFV